MSRAPSQKHPLSISTQAQEALVETLRSTLAAHKDDDVVDLTLLTSFDWDTLYVFGENTSSASINKTLGVTWLEDDPLYYVEELTDVLVFMKQGNVVSHVVVAGDLFVPAHDLKRFVAGAALFRVREVDDPVRPKVFIPVRP